MIDMVIGIDPGQKGAYTVLVISAKGGMIVESYPFAKYGEEGLLQIVWRNFFLGKTALFILEKIGPCMNPSVTHKLSSNYGFYRGVSRLGSENGAFIEVKPQKWQSDLGCLTRGDKNVSKAKATELLGQSFTHDTADSALLAYWGTFQREFK